MRLLQWFSGPACAGSVLGGRATRRICRRSAENPRRRRGREPNPQRSCGRVQLLVTDDPDLRRASALARILDTAVGIPGTKIRIGLDPVLGLVPGAGDVASAMLSAYIVLIAANKGTPRPVIWRMLGNIAVDTALGSVPVLGDLFDVAYKS